MIGCVDDLPQLEGLSRGDVTDYGTPQGGWSVPYRTVGGLTVTVYVYPCPGPALEPADARAIAAAEFARSMKEIHAFVGRGYREVVALDKSPARLVPSSIDPEALHQSFVLRTDEGSVFSELVLMVCRGQFIKVRGTYLPYPPVKEREQGRHMHRLLDALFQCSRRLEA